MRVVLDIETTGLDPRRHEVVAVGFTPADRFEPVVLVRLHAALEGILSEG